MKAQVLHKYDPEMKEKVWVTEQEMPDPKLEKSSDVIVKIGAAGVCRTDLHIVEGVWKHIQDPPTSSFRFKAPEANNPLFAPG